MPKTEIAKWTGRETLCFLGQFGSLFDRTEEFSSKLRSRGFSAFDPLVMWDESYAQNSDELALQRKIRREESKEVFIRAALRMLPDGTLSRNDGKSPFLEELRGERDARNGCPEDNLSEHFSLEECWIRRALCEADRRRRLESREIEETKEARAKDAASEILAIEAFQHATELSSRMGTTVRDRCEIFLDVAESHLGRHGFKRAEGPGRRLTPFLRKPLNDDWELRWAPEKDLTRLGSPEGIDDVYGIATYLFFDQLHVCAESLSGNYQDSGKIGEIFELKYHGLVPFIWQAYNRFGTNSTFETAVKARATLIGLLIDNANSLFARTFGGIE